MIKCLKLFRSLKGYIFHELFMYINIMVILLYQKMYFWGSSEKSRYININILNCVQPQTPGFDSHLD